MAQNHNGFYGDLATIDNVDLALQEARELVSQTSDIRDDAEVIKQDAAAIRDDANIIKGDAETASLEASGHASDSAASASLAGNSAVQAANSEAAAAASASAAAADAALITSNIDSAATNAASAEASATTATTKASEASTSATNAAASEAVATTKASEASTSATNAAASATTATTKASEASTSATNAAASEAVSTTKASEASTSATIAATKASEASTSATNAQSEAVRAELAASTADASAIALFSVSWWPERSSVPSGYVPADGQLLSRSTFPDAAAGIDAGMMPVVTESEWGADPLKRGSYTAGDGSTTFRMPDYNGQSAGAFGPLFLRGGASEGGQIQRDQIQNITGTLTGVVNRALFSGATTGAFRGQGANSLSYDAAGFDVSGYESATFDASRVVRTGTETRPLNVGGVWVIKLFGAVVNEGQADAAQLATDVASLSGRVSTVEGEKPMGWGQTWQDVIASRSYNTTYTNTTARPISVAVTVTGVAERVNCQLYVGGVLVSENRTDSTVAGYAVQVTSHAEVPPGATYRAVYDYGNLKSWKELR